MHQILRATTGHQVIISRNRRGEEIRKTKNKWLAAVLTIFLGLVGTHKFYRGHPKLGTLYILLACTVIKGVFTGWGGIVEGVMCLTKSDEKFQRVYVLERRSMF